MQILNQSDISIESHFETTVVPPIDFTDSAIQPEGRCIAEKLEQIGGERQPVVEKMTFNTYVELTLLKKILT